ncbi:MAG: DNA polymerase III subunit gamma/tau [Deltaproteobacteria bacterium]|nr:DNA polymerase III subunit gamma/tau [Deltaproteobacteria bacterium]
MSYIVLARKYRPQVFEEIIGQEHVTRTLVNSITAGRVAHAILFSGPRGTGKTTVARILAKAMNCLEGPAATPCNKCRSCKEITGGSAADVFEIDGASNNSVDQVRDLRENIRYMPQHSRYRIYIIDEVHMLSLAAFNALLKTIEEPPAHVLFFFATTEPQKIPVTILSRCQRHDLKRIGIESIAKHMVGLCLRENISVPEESLELIARESEGCMRDALSLLDQVISCSDGSVGGSGSAGGSVNHEHVIDILGVVDREVIFNITSAVIHKDIHKILEVLDDVYGRGHDLKKFYADLIEHIRNLIVVKTGKSVSKLVDVPAREIDLMTEQAKDISGTYLSQILDILFKEEPVIRFSANPRVAMEMTCIKMAQIKPVLPIEMLIEKLDTFKKKTDPEKEHSPPAVTTATYVEKSQDNIVEKSSDNIDSKATWKNLKEKICKKFPSLAAPLSKIRFTQVTEQAALFEVMGTGFDVKMIDRKKNDIEMILKDFFKRDIMLEIKSNINDDSRKEINRASRLKEEAMNHSLVADAVEIFDGRIVDIKIL